MEDETRSVSGFLHFDTATKGEALGIVECYRHVASISRAWAYIKKLCQGLFAVSSLGFTKQRENILVSGHIRNKAGLDFSKAFSFRE